MLWKAYLAPLLSHKTFLCVFVALRTFSIESDFLLTSVLKIVKMQLLWRLQNLVLQPSTSILGKSTFLLIVRGIDVRMTYRAPFVIERKLFLET